MNAKIVILLGLCLTGLPDSKAQTTDRETDAELKRIYVNDQEVRQQWATIVQTTDIDRIVAYQQLMERTDSANQAYVFELLETRGWPEQVSDSAHQAIFLVIDHAGLEAQQRYFPLVQEQSRKGNLSRAEVATLQDRICMREGRKQIYGTQTKTGEKDGRQVCYVWPVEHPEAIDSLRRSAGLPSMQEYLHLFQQAGIEAVWDKTLTVEEAGQLTKQIIIRK